MILRDDKLVALNEVLRSSEDIVIRYQDAADLVEDTHTAERLRALGWRREAFIERLREQVRVLGDLPQDVDVEREQLGELMDRVKAAFSGDRRRMLIEARLHAEESALNQVEAALAYDLPQAARRLLEDLKADIQLAQSALSKA